MAFRTQLLSLFAMLTMALPAAAQAPPQPAQAAPSGPVFCVSYFDTAPAGARQAAATLRGFAAESRKTAGNIEFTVLHEVGRPGRFAIVEAWKDGAALDAHGAAMNGLADKLQPVLATPFDARRFLTLAVAGPGAALANGAVYVLTHVDVFPAGKDQVAALVKQLADDSRKEGALRFDAVVWDGHPNHFHLIEAWSGRPAREAHAFASQTRQFRKALAPFEGAFYDERLYQAVR